MSITCAQQLRLPMQRQSRPQVTPAAVKSGNELWKQRRRADHWSIGRCTAPRTKTIGTHRHNTDGWAVVDPTACVQVPPLFCCLKYVWNEWRRLRTAATPVPEAAHLPREQQTPDAIFGFFLGVFALVHLISRWNAMMWPTFGTGREDRHRGRGGPSVTSRDSAPLSRLHRGPWLACRAV